MWFRSPGPLSHLGSFTGGRDCQKTQTDTASKKKNRWWRLVLPLPLSTSYHKPSHFGQEFQSLQQYNEVNYKTCKAVCVSMWSSCSFEAEERVCNHFLCHSISGIFHFQQKLVKSNCFITGYKKINGSWLALSYTASKPINQNKLNSDSQNPHNQSTHHKKRMRNTDRCFLCCEYLTLRPND